MNTKSLIRLTAFLMLCSIIFGCGKEEKSGSIFGVVTDFSSGEPVASANVQLRPGGETTLTGTDGMYEFPEVSVGSYSITVSKAGYTDLVDDYVIEVKEGKKVRRDVQIKPLPASLHIYDNESQEISELDFGADAGVIHKTFNIFNGGGKEINFTIAKSADWITNINPSTGTIGVNVTYPIVVSINRGLLSEGDNTTNLLITSSAEGGKELKVKARKEVELPKVSISEAIAIDSITYRVKCEVVSDGGLAVTERGICWNTFGDPTMDDETIPYSNAGTGQYTIRMEHLTMGTHYYVRAYAKNQAGIGFSEVIEFVTGAVVALPSVSTIEVYDVSATSAVCKGNVTDDGGSNIIERGVCWGTSANPTISGQHQIANGATTGTYIVSVTGLTANTTYHVRAYAKNIRGTAYGKDLTFATIEGLPTVTTASITNIATTSAKGGGTVTNQGASSVTERGICWSKNHNPTLNDNHANSGIGMGSYNCEITDLAGSTTYYVRAYAVNNQGVAFGSEVSFTTDQPSYTISTTSDPSEGGTTSGGGSYKEGQTCTIKATATTGYDFVRWTKDGTEVSTDASYSFTVTEEASFVAQFQVKSFTITVNADPAEGGSVSGGGSYTFGQICTVTASTLSGYAFVNWTENDIPVSTRASYSFMVTEDRELIGHFMPGIINGLFTVNSGGSQVYFSKGNLQYIGSANIWKFAESQWDVIGDIQGDGDQGTTRDLFGWGTSGYNHGANCYQPWSTSTNVADYYAYGASNGYLFNQSGMADWGYNAIYNGGNQEHCGWRTLTKDEWGYLFYSRNTTSGLRFVKARVNGLNGVILFPDNWDSSIYNIVNANSNSSFAGNVIDASTWLLYFEPNGVVFLPTAGFRNGIQVGAVGNDGYYWASTYYNANEANIVGFNEGYLDARDEHYRNFGFSVRLVRNAQF